MAGICIGTDWLSVIALLFTILWAGGASPPSRPVIEQHLDRSVEVYGSYAAVRLPINKGIRLWNPTAIHVGPKGEIYVANYVGEIFRIWDSDGDGLEDTASLFCNVTEANLRYPTTMAFRGNELFVGTAQQIRAYEDADGDGVADRSRSFLKLPSGEHTEYWTFGLRVGPDGCFYVNLSTDSYVGAQAPDPLRWRGSLLRITPDGHHVETFATGLRFAPGMAFHGSGALLFSDNEGGGNPTEELNVAVAGGFYGHNSAKFSANAPRVTPLIELVHGRGVCGITFNPSHNDFGGAAGDLFVAFWGVGQMAGDGSISRVKLWREDSGDFRARELPFCKSFAKPFDLAFGPSGDLYVTQFGPATSEMTPSTVATGAVVRFVSVPWVTPRFAEHVSIRPVRGAAERGKQLFEERCSQCHALNGTSELLGPNLVRLGDRLDYYAAREAVINPSGSIRSGFGGEIVETDDGEVIQGRIVTSDTTHLTLMVAGNQTVDVPRSSIRGHNPARLSLMPEGLVADLDDSALRDLFAHLGIQERPYRIRWRYRATGLAALMAFLVVCSYCLKWGLAPNGDPLFGCSSHAVHAPAARPPVSSLDSCA